MEPSGLFHHNKTWQLWKSVLNYYGANALSHKGSATWMGDMKIEQERISC